MDDNVSKHLHPVRPKENTLSETSENYLKRIYWLNVRHGHAKVSEIAALMGRSLSSTTEAMKRLKDQGLIHYEKYGKITLTDEGLEIGKKVNEAYGVIAEFLKLIGVEEEIAHEDACSMEHAITFKTVQRIKAFVNFINSDPVNLAVLNKFKQLS